MTNRVKNMWVTSNPYPLYSAWR